jgi:hypothetical protein
MDPIAPELLMALAGGTAGAAGQQIWTSLRELVTRRRSDGAPQGEGELTALAQAGDSDERAIELAEVLRLRAEDDSDFARALQAWRTEAENLHFTSTGSGDVRNEISGGTVHGNVVQARDIHGSIHFGS